MKDDKSIQNLCLHTHNLFCDGKQDINKVINNAISEGVTQIGISSHAPLKIPNKWSMSYESIDSYISEIEDCRQMYGNKIEIFISLEVDYIPNKSYSFDFFRKKMKLDYTIGSIHLVAHPHKDILWFIDGNKEECISSMMQIFDNNPKMAIKSFYKQTREMIRTQKPDMIGHLDKVIMNTGGFVDVKQNWYQEEIEQTLQLIKKQGVVVEANTRGIYKGKWNDTFPSKAILSRCLDLGITVTISSDAHHSDELLLAYEETRSLLKEIGFYYLQGRKKGKWGNFPI